MGDLSPYKVGAHQHVPEIKQATGATGRCRSRRCWRRCRAASWPPSPRRRPRRRRRRRGRCSPRRTPTSRSCTCCPRARWPHTAATLGSNACHLQATVDVDSGRVIVVSALDNLGKGAAGQAVQCANLMLGLPETTGLSRS